MPDEVKSPDLEPELARSLLDALGEWDNRASVAFAHLFLKKGPTEVLASYDDLALENPNAKQMLEDRYLSPPPDVEWLRALPEGTLGYAFAQYLVENGLDQNLLRESAFIDAHHRRGEQVGFLTERGFQLHDMFHVLTGFDTSPLGEIRIVSFTVAQTPSPYPVFVIALRLLQAALYRPKLVSVLLDAITEGWTLGRSARPLIPVHWEDHWERSLQELRAEYRLA